MADVEPVSSDIARFTDASVDYDKADMAWIIVATIFCWAIIPGIGLLYSGYTNRRNKLSPIWVSLLAMTVGSISWMLFGYTLTYGEGSSFIGDFSHIGHKDVLEEAAGALPALLYSVFQLVFSVATVAIFLGGSAERARLTALIPITFIWPLIVYSPVAHWTWSSSGWLYNLGAYDFAGGSPVHIASGAGSIAMGMYLSKPLARSRKSTHRSLRVMTEHRPHNIFQLFLALVLIWNGWLAFDGGSTLSLNLRSAVALSTTQISGCMGAITWSLWEYFFLTRKWSVSAVVSGAISGLVCITPGCGFVGLPASLLFGVVGGSVCFWASRFKHTRVAKKIGVVDPVDTSCHLTGGIAGNILTGIFAQKSIAATDGISEIAGGWLDGYFVQIGYQIADCLATTSYAFIVTYVLVALVDCIPGFEVLATDGEIYQGIDAACNGEYMDERQWADEHEQSPFLDDLEQKISSPGSPDTGEDSKEKSYGGGSRVQPVVSSAV